MTTPNPYRIGLDRNPANYQPLTPLSFLERAAATHPEHLAILHGGSRSTYGEFYARARRLASALAARGIGKDDTVSVILPNVPAMLEAHHGVPMAGAILHSINTRLDAAIIAFQLDHAEIAVEAELFAIGRPHVGDAARHAGGKVAAGRAEDDEDA